MNTFSVPKPDAYGGVMSRIRGRGNSKISIPELSGLLGVKTTTLNARLRRQRVAAHTVGRTNLYLGDCSGTGRTPQTRPVRMAYAAANQPHLRHGQAPSRRDAKRAAGELRDLTKRLRINPSELNGLYLRPARAKPAMVVRGLPSSGQTQVDAPARSQPIPRGRGDFTAS
jgi:hypothetical protein